MASLTANKQTDISARGRVRGARPPEKVVAAVTSDQPDLSPSLVTGGTHDGQRRKE